jgi:putative aldouronate transport system permease protein
MIHKKTIGERLFTIFNHIFLAFTAIVCIAPLIHVVAVSFSSRWAVESGMVRFWPLEFTLDPYIYLSDNNYFLRALLVSIERLAIGIPVNMLLTVFIAYPLSKEDKDFRARKYFVTYFIIMMLFNGGLIPLFLVVNKTGLIDKIWALILPTAVPVFNVVLLLNFFRQLPKDIEDAAFIDGASHFQILWNIYVALSKPAIATLILFVAVFHWNSWFDGLIFMNNPKNYPLQSFLQTVIIQKDASLFMQREFEAQLMKISRKNVSTAQIVLAMIPILMFYPFLQKYFTKGIVLGSVKG